MNNAGVQPGSGMFGPPENWARILGINLWGVIHGAQAFVPGMIDRGQPGLIINTGSKQGITTPPGDPAYNVAKAGVKVFTEALQHELRSNAECQRDRAPADPRLCLHRAHRPRPDRETRRRLDPEQTVDFMLQRLEPGDFYILCPDNDVPRSLDERRILWAAGDIVENRPPLSRWHPDYARAFEVFVKAGRTG